MRPVLPTRLPCEPDGEKYFTLKQIALKNGVAQRTVNRWIAAYGCPVLTFTGNQPIFTAAHVQALEKKRLAALAQKTGRTLVDDRDGGAGILSIEELREVKARANGNGKPHNQRPQFVLNGTKRKLVGEKMRRRNQLARASK